MGTALESGEAARLEQGAIPLVKYALVGVANTGIDFAVFATLNRDVALSPVASNLVSSSIAILASFAMNRSYTFSDPISTGSRTIIAQLFRFVTISLMGLAISSVLIHFIAPLIGALPAKIISIPIVMLWGYFLSRRLVFDPVA